MRTKENVEGVNQYLSFALGGEQYAVSLVQVKEIIECSALTHVPGAPPWIRGVLNLRGAVLLVVDLAVKFGMPRTEMTRRTCVLIVELRLEDEPMTIGVMADAVDQVLELAPSDIQPPPPFGPKVRIDCIEGMGDSDGKFVVLLNMNRILSSSELVTASDAAQAEATNDLAALEEITVA
jgi:purine-binding chemotaxis protein CheW